MAFATWNGVPAAIRRAALRDARSTRRHMVN
jgi:hypothetical protein